MIKKLKGSCMKIKTKHVSTKEALATKKPRRFAPKKPNIFFRTLIRLLSVPDLMSARFRLKKTDMHKAGKGPFLILMNHSSFIDLKLAYGIFYPMPFAVVTTTDGFIGKGWLMRQIGCIPTQKFVTDPRLVKDIFKARDKGLSVLMYPEAGYSFDGRATVLPRHLGKLIKKLNITVLSVMTDGAFLREPLYNELKKRRDIKVSAELKCLLTPEEIAALSAEEISDIIDREFSFDHFKAQLERAIKLDAPFRADGLERILYRCPACESEGTMRGEGTQLSCSACGKTYEMDIYGSLTALSGETEFSHIPDWYDYERECVRNELLSGEYRLDTEVEIGIIRDYKALYMVGTGRLIHTKDGFTLKSGDGVIHYTQSPKASYSLNADYYWYEIGDVISIGDNDTLYYCFTKQNTPVAKARLATEELYKITNEK